MHNLFTAKNTTQAPRIIAHRGASAVEPENSLPAFDAAGALGVWAIETDVYKTLDGTLVCFHNKRVDGKTNGEGEIASMRWDDLRRLKITCGNNLEAHDDNELKIPTLAEYLSICKRHGSVPFIELKMPIADEVIAAVRAAEMEERCVISSTSLSVLERARVISRAVFIHLIFGDEGSFERLRGIGYSGLSFKIASLDDVPSGLIERTHDAGLRVCFRAADTRESMLRAISMGCDYVPSNKIMTL